jgi:pimeloyl-ACP methyl ester carboxylesterase
LLHGFLKNKGMWDFYIPEFAKKNRVITIDLLGHGETECLSYVQTMEDNADAVHAVLSELRLRKAILSGILWAVMSLWLCRIISRHDKGWFY